MKIRLIQETDILPCLELLKQLTVSKSDFDYTQVFSTLSKDPNTDIYVVEIENVIVGMATILIEQKFIHSGKCVGHIEDVVVSNKYRKQGIGKQLLEKCIEVAKENNCYKVILDCDEENVPFYSKVGFKPFGISMKINF